MLPFEISVRLLYSVDGCRICSLTLVSGACLVYSLFNCCFRRLTVVFGVLPIVFADNYIDFRIRRLTIVFADSVFNLSIRC